jgi:hypothetical protein
MTNTFLRNDATFAQVDYASVTGAPTTISASPIANSITADVNLSNTGNYFTGPSVSQGTAGTWFASGTVCVLDSAGVAGMFVKLWDGTTIIDSAASFTTGANDTLSISVSGFIASPAGGLRIDVRDETSTNGKIKFNISGLSADSTLTAFRIA